MRGKDTQTETFVSLLFNDINEIRAYIAAHPAEYAAFIAAEQEKAQRQAAPPAVRRKSRKCNPPKGACK